MATEGTIEQYQGPFYENYTLTFNGNCIIGVSIGEDDYMKLGSTTGDKSFRFLINGHQIWMGRTYLYQTEKAIEDNNIISRNTIISFPDGAPASVLIEVVYCSRES